MKGEIFRIPVFLFCLLLTGILIPANAQCPPATITEDVAPCRNSDSVAAPSCGNCTNAACPNFGNPCTAGCSQSRQKCRRDTAIETKNISTLPFAYSHAAVNAPCTADVCCCDECYQWDTCWDDVNMEWVTYCVRSGYISKGVGYVLSLATSYTERALPFEFDGNWLTCTGNTIRADTDCNYYNPSFEDYDCMSWECTCPVCGDPCS